MITSQKNRTSSGLTLTRLLDVRFTKRRPAIVVSRREYSERTGFVAVCPITHGQSRLEEQGLLVPVRSNKVDGSVNPLQLYTFDFRERKAQKITTMDTTSFQKVVQLYNFIFEA